MTHITEDDIVAIGGKLDPDTLIAAYEAGVFPWPMDDVSVMPWFCPRERAILEFADLHVSRSLERARRKLPYFFTVDRAFDQVLAGCAAAPRPGQDGTWITPGMTEAYQELHRRGVAHSVEAWAGDRLVGGIYGVASSRSFSAESMFYHEPYASKLALLHLIDRLKASGLTWIDIQVMTEHMLKMGAKTIARASFLRRLREGPVFTF